MERSIADVKPVYVPGAKLSFGDLHFSIGEGELTTAIQMAGIVTFRVNILPPSSFPISSPAYLSAPPAVHTHTAEQRLVFTGLSQSHASTSAEGRQLNMDGMSAYRNAAFQAIDHLVRTVGNRRMCC